MVFVGNRDQRAEVQRTLRLTTRAVLQRRARVAAGTAYMVELVVQVEAPRAAAVDRQGKDAPVFRACRRFEGAGGRVDAVADRIALRVERAERTAECRTPSHQTEGHRFVGSAADEGRQTRKVARGCAAISRQLLNLGRCALHVAGRVVLKVALMAKRIFVDHACNRRRGRRARHLQRRYVVFNRDQKAALYSNRITTTVCCYQRTGQIKSQFGIVTTSVRMIDLVKQDEGIV